MTIAHPAKPLRWIMLAWTVWIAILFFGTLYGGNGNGRVRAILFLAITAPILAVWLVAWRKSSQR